MYVDLTWKELKLQETYDTGKKKQETYDTGKKKMVETGEKDKNEEIKVDKEGKPLTKEVSITAERDTDKPLMAERDSGVELMVRPLDYQPYQQVLGLLTQGMKEDDLQDEKKVAAAFNSFSNPKLQSLVKEILPVHCKDLKGVTIKEIHGEREGKIEDLYKYGHFLIMSVQILTNIFNLSSMGGKAEDLKKQLPEQSEEVKPLM